MTEYENKDGLIGSSTSVKQIPLFPDRLGEFTAENLPFSVERIVELYEREMEYLFIHYTDYSMVEQLGVSVDEVHNGFGRFLRNRKVEAVTHIAPHSTMRNPGTIPMLAMDLQLGAAGEKDYKKW